MPASDTGNAAVLARALLQLADAAGMTDSFWAADSRIRLACDILGVPAGGRYSHCHLWDGDHPVPVTPPARPVGPDVTRNDGAEPAEPGCPRSGHADGRSHAWQFDGDDPYILCSWCSEIRDALTGRVIQPGQPA